MLRRLSSLSAAFAVLVAPACATYNGAYAREYEPAPLEGGTFVHAGVNPDVVTSEDALSTFAVDVDTGSWMYARRMLDAGTLPNQGSVRVEEFVNALHYDYAAPGDEQPAMDGMSDDAAFAIHVAAAPSPFRQGKHVARIALQARRVSKEQRKPATLTFLVDVSGSMGSADKLGWVQKGLHMAVDTLRHDDRMAIVTYAGDTRVVLPATPVTDANKRAIHSAIGDLESGGGTFMSSGMELAYEEAARELGAGRTSRVFVLSDGDANIGTTSHEGMLAAIEEQVTKGVTMSTMGFGTGNYNDYTMEQLADAGNGNYTYIGDEDALKRFFVDEMTANLELVASDAKVQVEWNADAVKTYRLLGYENRDIADEDFKNDKKDAGEIGAGHAVTALYEIELTADARAAMGRGVEGAPVDLATVRVRHKVPGHDDARETAVALRAADVFEEVDGLDADAQAALGMALAAEILRGSEHAAGLTLVDAALLLKRSARGFHAEERLAAAELFMRAPNANTPSPAEVATR